MKIIAILIAAIANFTSLAYTLIAFYTIDSVREHPWIKPKLSLIEGKYSEVQHKIAHTQLKEAQLYLAKKAMTIAMVSCAFMIVSHHYELNILTLVLMSISAITFYISGSIYFGYRPIWVLKFISPPYIKLALLIFAAGCFELLFGLDIISSVVDQLINIEIFAPVAFLFTSALSKLVLLSLFPVFLGLFSFVVLYIFSMPGFFLTSLLMSLIIFFAKFIDAAEPEKKLSLTCLLYIFVQENLKKYFDINN
ncbi:hypothetical protein SB581_07505 [Acinetobacter baumannii]|nr:hypothetical protein SB581_07505 [Acinetobacter baumannii]